MIYLGLDDTDTQESRGTGHLARMLGRHLEEQGYRLYGITRHQLLIDPRVPYTAKNSCATLHIRGDGEVDIDVLAEQAAHFVLAHAAGGSDPAVCASEHPHEEITAFGRRVQSDVVDQDEARLLADAHGLILHGLAGTQDGVIGALAGVGLAASGHDGRFIHVGTVRHLVGLQPIAAILAAGVAEVRDLDGQPVTDGLVETGGKLRPAFREGLPLLHVRPDGGRWLPVRFD